MKIIYKIFSESIIDEKNKPILIYRILSENVNGKTLEIHPDIFLDKVSAEEFVNLCNIEMKVTQ